MLQSDSKSIRQMLQNPDLTIQDLLDRQDLSSDVRNLSLQFSNMLNYQNMKKIMHWLIKQGSQQNKQSYKFPLVASQIVAMQTPNINQHLFFPGQNKQPLFQYLYSFTEEKDNYILAGYFSKVLIAIIKRQANSQYYQLLCKYFYYHLYSTSTIDLILRVFTLRSKNNDYYEQKKVFVLRILEMMERQQLSDEISLLNYEPSSNTGSLGSNNSLKSPNHDIKQIPYEDPIIKLIFQSLGNTNRIRKTKAKIVTLYLNQFKITDDYILYRTYIDNYLELVIKYVQEKAESKSKVTLEQIFIVDNLYLILQFPLQLFMNKSVDILEGLFELVVSNGWNNIFHQQVYKIINLLLRSDSKKVVQILTVNLVKFTELSVKHYSGEVGYTRFILNIAEEVMNVYEKNAYQQSEEWVEFWESVKQILNGESEYSVGDYLFKPHTIAFVYSRQNVVKQYAQFLNTPTQIVYETKQDNKKDKEKQKDKDANIQKEDKQQQKQTPREIQTQQNKQCQVAQTIRQSVPTKSQQIIQKPIAAVPKQQIIEHYLVFPRPQIKTQIETSINQSQKEDNQMLQYWRQRIHYSLQQLMDDI